MPELREKHCQVCEGGVTPLSEAEAQSMLTQVHADWALSENGKAMVREFKFKDFYRTMAFANAIAWIAHQQDHHPNLEIGYSRVKVRYSTHAIGGLSENDFICAAKIDALAL